MENTHLTSFFQEISRSFSFLQEFLQESNCIPGVSRSSGHPDFKISDIENSEKTKKPEKPENKLLTKLLSLEVSIDEIKKNQIHMVNIGIFIIRLDYPIVTI